MGAANAVQTGPATITCANQSGAERTTTVNWDNSNSYFNGKGDIARLFCEGGFSGEYRTFVSTSVTDLALRYYNGSIPVSSAPSETDTTLSQPVVQDTATSTVETSTSLSQPSTVDSPTATQSDTSTVQQETVTPSAPVETHTSGGQSQSSDTSTLSTVTETQTSLDGGSSSETSTLPSVTDSETVLVDTSTTLSDTATVPVDTSTAQLPIPQPESLPTPDPAVEPQPVPLPAVQEPQPEPQPQPIEDEAPVVEENPASEPENPTQPNPEPSAESPQEENASAEPEIQDPVVEPDTPEDVPDVPETPQETPIVENIDTEPSVVVPLQPPVVSEGATVTLDNGVVLEAEVAEALEVLDNPAELLADLFTDPGKVLLALGNVGADMSPESRQKSQDAVVQAVIVGSIVSQAAGAAIRRKP